MYCMHMDKCSLPRLAKLKELWTLSMPKKIEQEIHLQTLFPVIGITTVFCGHFFQSQLSVKTVVKLTKSEQYAKLLSISCTY